MATPNDPQDSEPIDVEFSPAEGPEVKTIVKSGGPGWVGLISAGVLAALAGGAIGVVASGTEGRYAQAAEVALDISKLEEFDRDLTTRLNQMRDALRETEARLNSTIKNIENGENGAQQAVLAVRSDLETLKSRYIALLGESALPEADVTPGGQAPAGSEGNAGPDAAPGADAGQVDILPEPSITLAALMDRLNSIEGGGVSGQEVPKDLARTVTALQNSTNQLETVDKEFSEAMRIRQAALSELETQVAALEASLGGVTNELTATGEQVKAGQEADQKAISELTTDLENLRNVLTEKLENMGPAELSTDEQFLVRRADRVLALSALETAVRSESEFSSQIEQLSLMLPANAQVSALRRMASEGVPTLETLRAELAGLSDTVAKIGMPEKPTGKWAWVGDLLSGVVSVREEGSAQGKTASGRIAAALSAIDGGDLAAAVNEIKQIDGEKADALKSWLTSAERRLRANDLLGRLRSDVMDGDQPQ